MPAYRVEIRSSAARDLERLPPILLDRVEARVHGLADDPRGPGSRKLGDVDLYRVRVGDHRIVYRIDDRSRVVTVTNIGHRRDVYRKLR